MDNHAKPAKRSWEDDQRILDGFVKYFGNVRLSEITSLKLENYRRDKKSGVSDSTVEGKKKKISNTTTNRHMAALKTMFSKAVEWGKTTENPAKRIKFYSENNARTRFLERGEITALLTACPSWLKPIVTVAIHAGLRKGEIVNLNWDDIDFKNMVLRVRDSKNKSPRYVPMSLPLAGALRAIKRTPDSPYVFACDDRTQLYGRIRYAFEETVKDAGLSGDVVFHSLRQSFASHLVMKGVDLLTVDTLMPPEPSRPPTHAAEEFTKNVFSFKEKLVLFPGGEMVSQRTLNPLFLVRAQAWERGFIKEA